MTAQITATRSDVAATFSDAQDAAAWNQPPEAVLAILRRALPEPQAHQALQAIMAHVGRPITR